LTCGNVGKSDIYYLLVGSIQVGISPTGGFYALTCGNVGKSDIYYLLVGSIQVGISPTGGFYALTCGNVGKSDIYYLLVGSIQVGISPTGGFYALTCGNVGKSDIYYLLVGSIAPAAPTSARAYLASDLRTVFPGRSAAGGFLVAVLRLVDGLVVDVVLIDRMDARYPWALRAPRRSGGRWSAVSSVVEATSSRGS
ncbi:hypothetical protein ACWGPQ_21895, partial [Saccharomonospora azurea]